MSTAVWPRQSQKLFTQLKNISKLFLNKTTTQSYSKVAYTKNKLQNRNRIKPTSIRTSETIPVVGPQKIYKSKVFWSPQLYVGRGCSPFLFQRTLIDWTLWHNYEKHSRGIVFFDHINTFLWIYGFKIFLKFIVSSFR